MLLVDLVLPRAARLRRLNGTLKSSMASSARLTSFLVGFVLAVFGIVIILFFADDGLAEYAAEAAFDVSYL